jgi:ADP-ribose pyrophosphatase YjhB (NUDIX family)
LGVIEKGRRKIKGGDDAAKARWFDIEKLPKSMVFDHDEVTKFAIARLKKEKDIPA